MYSAAELTFSFLIVASPSPSPSGRFRPLQLLFHFRDVLLRASSCPNRLHQTEMVIGIQDKEKVGDEIRRRLSINC